MSFCCQHIVDSNADGKKKKITNAVDNGIDNGVVNVDNGVDNVDNAVVNIDNAVNNAVTNTISTILALKKFSF